jgi:hypothetical protein
MSVIKSLGWREWVGLPELNIRKIKAKIDTGAKTSALHAFRVEPFERDARAWVRFAIHPRQRDTETVVECEAPVVDRRLVRDSGGHTELRYVIETVIAVGNDLIRTEMTLTDRDSMKFRVLVGRSALRGEYLVNAGESYLQGKPKGTVQVKKRNWSG